MIGSELAIPVIIIMTSIIIISYLLFQFNQNISKARTVRVINSGKVCNPALGELPVIPVKECTNKNGELVECYQPNPAVDLTFEIGTSPVYFRSICTRLCKEINTNGGCVNESSTYQSCLTLLEPPGNCNSSANALGRLTGTSDIYYAQDIITR